MIEILVIWLVARKIGNIAKQKGRSRGWYIFLTITLWIGGEIVGALVGAIVTFELSLPECLIYPFTLGGAACGLGLAYLIASSVSDRTPAFAVAEEQALPENAEAALEEGPRS